MIYIVANKTAGHGAAAAVLDNVRAYLNEKKVQFIVGETQAPFHATELAAQAVSNGAKCVFALGGDGTVREVAEGMKGSSVPMGIIPAGTGNDISKAVNLPGRPIEALQAGLDGTARRVDLGMINDLSFVNIVGTGFDVNSLRWTLKFKKMMRGLLPYLIGGLLAIITHKNIDVKLTIDGLERRLPIMMISVANGKCFGGGMKVAPDAELDDGLFDVVIVHPVPRWKIPLLLPKFISGKVKTIKYAETLRCKEAIIEREGQYMNVDGELIPMDRAHIRILPSEIWMQY
ncbi:MAG: diacylglycerol/lipid kinase family protein [Christensenellales bacterium]|jgi:diacylglycerol kinase (ATP)